KKLTQTQLADLLDTTKQTISRYEKINSNPTRRSS
ncbi:helix-turn-helix domain-containing protein, partial [Streptococcus agalactiae]